MSLRKLRNEKGFTIVEVVLVLAIAGLIFLIVFLALPALQRSRRDTQRKADVSRVMAQLESYAGNNDGSYPTATGGNTATEFGDAAADTNAFIASYVLTQGSTLNNPGSGSLYTILFGTANADAATDFAGTGPTAGDELVYAVGAVCSGEFMTASSGTREIAVVIELEDGNSYCQDNR